MQTISFHYLVSTFNFPQRTKLKIFLEDLFKKENKKFHSLTYIFCSDQYLLKINKDFLHHDYLTDIITFNLAEKPNEIIGEVYISVERVKDNATQLKEKFKTELHRVIFHGALHLCGYKDKSVAQIITMRKKESYYLNLYL